MMAHLSRDQAQAINDLLTPLAVSISGFPGSILRCQTEGIMPLDFEAIAGLSLPADLLNAIASRQVEYLAGRALSALAAVELGQGPFFPGRRQRQPIWQDPVVGSISHSKNTVIVALAIKSTIKSLGIDCEHLQSDQKFQKIARKIVSASEWQRLRSTTDLDSGSLGYLCFSMKEALFKAIYPLIEVFFGFEDAEITFCDANQGTIEWRLTRELHPAFPEGLTGNGRFFIDQRIGQVVSLVWL